MRFNLAVLIVLLIGSCSGEEPDYYFGKSSIEVKTDSLDTEVLKRCMCWQTDESINLMLGNMGFEGTLITINNFGRGFKTQMDYHFDTKEQLQPILLESKKVKINYTIVKDSIIINGELDLSNIKTGLFVKGDFECTLLTKANN